MTVSMNSYLSTPELFAAFEPFDAVVRVNFFAVAVLSLLVLYVASRLVSWLFALSSDKKARRRSRNANYRSSRRRYYRAVREFRNACYVAAMVVFLVCLLSLTASDQVKEISTTSFSVANLFGNDVDDSSNETTDQILDDFQITSVSVTTSLDNRGNVDAHKSDSTEQERSEKQSSSLLPTNNNDRLLFVPNVVKTSSDRSLFSDDRIEPPVESAQSPQALTRSEQAKPEKARNLASTSYQNNKRIFAPVNARDVDSEFLSGRIVDNNSALLDAFSPKNKIVSVGAELPSGANKGALIDNSVNAPSTGRVSAENLIEQLNYEMLQITEKAQTGVLSISVPKPTAKDSTATQEETGSGFIFVYEGEYYAGTNEHVVRERASDDSINVTLPNNQLIHPVEVFCSPELDVAVLRLNPKDLPKDDSVTPVSFDDSDFLRVSNIVFAFGSPFGLTRTMSLGHVSALRRTTNDVNTSNSNSSNINVLSEFIQLDASINPGNSGGPLYNARGKVVGMVTLIATRTGANEGIAFAIPSNVFLRVAKSLIDHKGEWRRSRLGVELTPATRADLASTSINKACGAKIVRVVANSPAVNAGLRAGDLILTYNGETVLNDSQLNRMIALTDSREKVRIGVLRGNQFFELESSVLRSRQYSLFKIICFYSLTARFLDQYKSRACFLFKKLCGYSIWKVFF